jgi:hypothetical protein
MTRWLFILLSMVAARGATILVASYGDGTAAKANFDSAYAAAAHGDTIRFPLSGSATWSASATLNKAVTVDGNGTTLTAGVTLANGFFYTSAITNSALFRITGFTFNLVNLASGGHGILILGNVDLSSTRIDHNTFNHGEIQIEIGGCKGVVDHNYFYNGMSAVYFTAGTRAQADASWVDMSAGTSDALFFEDNQFIHDANYLSTANNACFDTYNGGKLVVRYNTFTASFSGIYSAILTHGSAGGGAAIAYWQADANARRGQSVVEIYNNTMSAIRIDFMCQLRGSANLVHDNTLDTQTFTPRLQHYEEEGDVTQWSPLRTAWPAEDQVHNSFYWANTLRLNGVANTDYVDDYASSGVTWIQEGRDYEMHAPQATGGREVFTGANGAAGSHPTDGSPYATAGTMQRLEGVANAYYPYTPYTYPHPLTTGGSGGGDTSTAPTQNGVSHRGGVRIK